MEWEMISHCIYCQMQEEYVAFYRANSSFSVDYHNSYIHSVICDDDLKSMKHNQDDGVRLIDQMPLPQWQRICLNMFNFV